MVKPDDLSMSMSNMDDVPERSWGLDVEDIEAISAKQIRGEIEKSTCYYCNKPMFRISDYSARTLTWNHSSTGYPQSYSPQQHDARREYPVEPHDHTWVEAQGFSWCDVEDCGARKLHSVMVIPKGVFMPSVKDQQLAASRARGLAAGTEAQKKKDSERRPHRKKDVAPEDASA